MAVRDKVFDQIERDCDAPMISCNWTVAEEERLLGRGGKTGRKDWFRKLPDIVRARRSKQSTDSDMHEACDIAIYFLKYYLGSGCNPLAYEDREVWSHNVLHDMARWQRHRSGKEQINSLAQAMLRDAMHLCHRSEERGL